MSKILIHSIAFNPDGVSTAYLYNDIALKFKESGFDVVVLTTTPHYNVISESLNNQLLKPKLLGLYYESNFGGIVVKHVPQKKFKNSVLRMLGFIYWHFISFVLGLFEKKVDIVLSPSPPLTIGLINICLAKLNGAKVIYNIQEIYPDLLIENGGLKSNFIIFVLKKLEIFVYNHSDAATTIDKVFYDTIINRFKVKSKLTVIPNFVDTHIYKPLIIKTNDLDQNHFPENDSIKVMYAGNIGHAQDWKTLIDIATRLKDVNIEFFVIGEGVMKDFLEKEIISKNLSKIHLIPYQLRELMPKIIAYSDLQFIFMSPRTEGHGFPSKVYTIMACAKPMIVCSGANTPIINFLVDKECAFLIKERDLKIKTNKIVEILKTIDKNELTEMGNRGLTHIKLNYSKEKVTDMYVDLANTLLS